MKIRDVKYDVLSIPLKKSFKVALSTQDHAETVVVKVQTDEGVFGIGEAAPFEPVTGENKDSVINSLRLFKDVLIGMDPMNLESIHLAMNRLMIGNTSAKAAIDIALHDLKGKAMNEPLYKILGGNSNSFLTDMTIGIDSPENMAKEALKFVEENGFKILKVKVGLDSNQDIEAIRLIRESVGPNIRIRADANQGYSVNEAVRTLKAFEEYNVEAVEQCVPWWDFDGLKYIRSKVNLKIMVDESVHSSVDAMRVCKTECADVINIKLMKCGGLYQAEKINAIAEASHIECMVGCMLESKIGIAAAGSLVAAKANITEADCDSFMYAKDPEMGIRGGFTITNGEFKLSDKPGLGLEINF